MLKIAVDASCQGNPGLVQYRGVNLDTQEEIFCSTKMDGGTNNIGEFLAVVQAMQYLFSWKQTGEIYTDSRTALSWIRNGEMNTQANFDEMDDDLVNDIDFADTFLEVHGAKYKDCVGFWNTKKQGENPADFGRKGKGKSVIPVGTSIGQSIVPHNLKRVAPPVKEEKPYHKFPFNPETGLGLTAIQMDLLDFIEKTKPEYITFNLLSEVHVKFPTLDFRSASLHNIFLFGIEDEFIRDEEATIGQSFVKFIKELPKTVLTFVETKPLS